MGMGGLLGGGQGQGSGVAPVNFNGEDEEEVEPNVEPEEQAQYDQFVKNGMELIYTAEGQVNPDVLKRLSTGKKPMEALAQASVWLVLMLEGSAEKSGSPIEDDVVMHAGRELMEQLLEVMEAADIHDFTEGEVQGAWYNALDMYREASTGGRFKPEIAGAEFEALNEATKEGRGDEVLPGFERESERGFAMAMRGQHGKEPDAQPDGSGQPGRFQGSNG